MQAADESASSLPGESSQEAAKIKLQAPPRPPSPPPSAPPARNPKHHQHHPHLSTTVSKLGFTPRRHYEPGLPKNFNATVIYKLISAEHFETRLMTRFWWPLLAISAAAFVLCLVMLGVYLHLHPITPDVVLLDLQLSYMGVGPVDAATLLKQQQQGKYYGYTASYEFIPTISIVNENNKVDFFVDSVHIRILYAGFSLAKAKTAINYFSPRHGNGTFVKTIIRDDVGVPLNIGYTMNYLMLETTIPFVFDVTLEMRARASTVHGLRSPPFYIMTRCSMNINRPVRIAECSRVNA